MSIPTNESIRSVMTYLVDAIKRPGPPIVLVTDLMTTCGLDEAEYQLCFRMLFQAGVLRPLGDAQLQVDYSVREYAMRLSHCTLMDVMQFFGSRRHRNQAMFAALFAANAKTLYSNDEDSDKRLIVTCLDVERELIGHLARKPDDLFLLSPRKFEELVASIVHNHGFTVELTPQTRDGGVDIIAVENSAITGTSKYLIECKRYAPDNKVGIGIVQRLAGVVGLEHATKGMIVTTSSFSRDAQRIAAKTPHVLTLHDYDVLVGWIKHLSIRKP